MTIGMITMLSLKKIDTRPFSSVVEHFTCNEAVLGSSPRGGSNIYDRMYLR